jgi:DNA-binding response OmpR family regulator
MEARPAVVVVDVEAYDGANHPGWENWRSVPQVIIGTVRLPAASTSGATKPATRRRYLQKPFQFADLVHAIEALIAEQSRDLNDDAA